MMLRKKPVQTFLEGSSMKGVPKIVKSKYYYQKILWLLALLLGLGIGGYMLYRLLKSFFSYKTTVNNETIEETPPLPDLTVCRLQLGSEDHDFLKYSDYLKSIGNMIYEHELASKDKESIQHKRDIGQLYMLYGKRGYYQNVGSDLALILSRQIINFCHFKIWDEKLDDPLYLKLKKEGMEFHCHDQKFTDYIGENGTRTYFSSDFGPCITLSMAATDLQRFIEGVMMIFYLDDFHFDITAADPYYPHVGDQFARGLRVLLHEAGTMPDMTKGFNVGPGFETTIRLNTIERTRLQSPYGTCTDQEYIGPSKYTSHACQSLCYQKRVIDKCGCVDGFALATKEDLTNYDFCGKLTTYDETMSKLRCADQISSENFKSTCKCPIKCKEYQYVFNSFQVPWPHEDYLFSFYDFFKHNPYVHGHFEWYDYLRGAMWNAYHINDTFTYESTFEELRRTTLIQRNFINFKIIFESSTIEKVKDVPAIEGEAFVGSMGGLLNLWVGISFVTFIELLELLLNCLVSRAEKVEDQNTKVVPVATKG